MHFPRGVIRTAEVEECGRWSLRPVSFLVPLELDCHHEGGEIRQCLRDDNGRNANNNDDLIEAVDSISEAGGLGSPNVSADAQERSIPHGTSPTESTSHRTPGSSRESGSATGTNDRCNIANTGTPNTFSLPLSPNLPVSTQASRGEDRDAGAGEPVT